MTLTDELLWQIIDDFGDRQPKEALNFRPPSEAWPYIAEPPAVLRHRDSWKHAHYRLTPMTPNP